MHQDTCDQLVEIPMRLTGAPMGRAFEWHERIHILRNELERAAEAARQAAKWLADHPWVLVGTIILISGVLFIVVVVGGGLVLTPLAA